MGPPVFLAGTARWARWRFLPVTGHHAHVHVNLGFRGRLSRVRSPSPERTMFRRLQTLSGAISAAPFFCLFCLKGYYSSGLGCAGLPAAHGPSPAAAGGSASPAAQASHCRGCSVAERGLWGASAPVAAAHGGMWCVGFVVLWHVGSSQSKDQTSVSCTASCILNHWTTREALYCSILVMAPGRAQIFCSASVRMGKERPDPTSPGLCRPSSDSGAQAALSP